MSSSEVPITPLLHDLNAGEPGAVEALMPRIYGTLHRLANHHFRDRRPGLTWETSDLVQETCLRLMQSKSAQWNDRAHFFGCAAHLMREILVDYIRKRNARKRGGDQHRVDLDEALVSASEDSSGLLALDEALTRLEATDARKARVVELRYFGGLSIHETAEALGVHRTTVVSDWTFAKAWLRRELEREI